MQQDVVRAIKYVGLDNWKEVQLFCENFCTDDRHLETTPNESDGYRMVICSGEWDYDYDRGTEAEIYPGYVIVVKGSEIIRIFSNEADFFKSYKRIREEKSKEDYLDDGPLTDDQIRQIRKLSCVKNIRNEDFDSHLFPDIK